MLPLDGAQAAASSHHARATRTTAVGGRSQRLVLRLNRRGRRALESGSPRRYRLLTEFRDLDGRTARRSNRITLAAG